MNVLHVVKWYPNRYDVQNGAFIKKHVECSSSFAHVKVLAWMDSSGKTEVVESIENDIPTTRVYFKLKTAVSYKRHAFRDYIQGHYNNKELPDLIHLHVFSPDLLLVVNWAKRKKIPVVISEHWSGYIRGVFQKMPLWRKTAFRQLGRRVNVILPVSEFLQDHMIENRIKGNYKIVPNVVEENLNKPKKQAGYAFVVVADFVDEIKNISGTIKAFDVAAQNNNQLSLHIIGDGPDADWLKSTAASMASSTRIHFYGRLPNDEVLKVLPSFHGLVNNSRVESFGVTILEAHAAGIPVISTRCGGPNEWIEDGDLAVAIGDQKQLVEAMKKIASNQGSHQFKKYKACLPKHVSETLKSTYTKMLNARQKN